MARNGNSGSATSAASVRVRRRRAKKYADWVPLAQLRSDLERGIAYFWSKRPVSMRPSGDFNRFDLLRKELGKGKR